MKGGPFEATGVLFSLSLEMLLRDVVKSATPIRQAIGRSNQILSAII